VVTYHDEWVVVDGCPVKVKYRKHECIDLFGNKLFIFSDFEMKPSMSVAACQNLIGKVTDNHLEYVQNLNEFYKKVTIAVEKKNLSEHSNSNIVMVHWIETKCLTYCVAPVDPADPNSLYLADYVQCGESCCRRSTNYVKVGSEWIGYNPTVSGDPTCTNVYNYSCPLPGGNILTNFCSVACDRL
jgi:hypothetical protein